MRPLALNTDEGDHHVVMHVKHERGQCRCGRGPQRPGGAGNCLACHRESQARHRKRRADELRQLRSIVEAAGLRP